MKKLTLILLLIVPFTVLSEVIDKKRSLYQNVYVIEEEGMRCLRFRLKNADGMSQSCIYLDSPEVFVFDYYKQAMAANFFLDQPKRILIIGLGGGMLARAYEFLYPQAAIDSVEIDDVVVDMARLHFGYSDERNDMNTFVQDGRVYVKRAKKQNKQYDLILLDAFNADYIPEHMMTREYLEEVKSLLTPSGIVMANTYSHSKLFHHESATYQAVFGKFYYVGIDNPVANRVIIAATESFPEPDALRKRANRLKGSLSYLGVDVLQLLDALSTEVNWDAESRILTDQYSPANLLNE